MYFTIHGDSFESENLSATSLQFSLGAVMGSEAFVAAKAFNSFFLFQPIGLFRKPGEEADIYKRLHPIPELVRVYGIYGTVGLSREQLENAASMCRMSSM